MADDSFFSKNKTPLLFGISLVLLFIFCVIVITCSLFDSKPETEQKIPVDWRKKCIEKNWKVTEHNAQTDTSVPLFFTTFLNMEFSNKNNNFSVIINKENSSIGPFGFVFTSDNSGTISISYEEKIYQIKAVFSDQSSQTYDSIKYRLVLTVPSGKKINLSQD